MKIFQNWYYFRRGKYSVEIDLYIRIYYLIKMVLEINEEILNFLMDGRGENGLIYGGKIVLDFCFILFKWIKYIM